MSQKKQLSIKEFSHLTGIKRENLRFYDRIGLLSPESRGDNNYRYYSRHQLNTAYLIGGLRGVGVGIGDIKDYLEKRAPEDALGLFSRQEERIQKEISQLKETSLIMHLYSDMVQEALAHKQDDCFLLEKPQEPIFLCPEIPIGMDSDEGEVVSYDYAEENGVNLGFPQGTFIAQRQILSADAPSGYRYYFKAGNISNTWKPQGLYAVAYGRCDPWKPQKLYLRLFEFIKEQEMRVCGDAYEEYPLGDFVEQDSNQYCLRIEIPVEKVVSAHS